MEKEEEWDLVIWLEELVILFDVICKCVQVLVVKGIIIELFCMLGEIFFVCLLMSDVCFYFCSSICFVCCDCIEGIFCEYVVLVVQVFVEVKIQ